ncbi:MAG: response regulator transcription factor [Sulfurovum sp.]|nr:response regulator transcription factor [Sulfurovum sp.]
MKILLLEDDALLAESLKEYLELEGYSVDTVGSGGEVFDRTFDEQYDLYILDINVPDINGLEVLKALKDADDTTPAIYISAMTDIKSITQGFKVGAVDYIKKPFDPEELLVRIRHHLGSKDDTVAYEGLLYHPKNGKVIRGDSSFYLSEIQKKIFDRLLLCKGDIVSSEELMEFLDRPSPNALRVTMTKLKKKLKIDIKNIRSQGYTLETL